MAESESGKKMAGYRLTWINFGGLAICWLSRSVLLLLLCVTALQTSRRKREKKKLVKPFVKVFLQMNQLKLPSIFCGGCLATRGCAWRGRAAFKSRSEGRRCCLAAAKRFLLVLMWSLAPFVKEWDLNSPT